MNSLMVTYKWVQMGYPTGVCGVRSQHLHETKQPGEECPELKGSKNKPKTVTADFATQIAEKQSAKETLSAEIASITANIDTLKADLKVKKTALKKAEKEVTTLEAKKAKADVISRTQNENNPIS